MNERIKRYGKSLYLIAIVLCGTAVVMIQQNDSIAQPPRELPVEEAAIQEAILRALDGEQPPANANEPLLGDVYKFLRDQGSILDGSPLNDVVEEQSPSALKHADEKAYRAAEALLKASRLLSQLTGPEDTARKRLIGQMRQEAQACMAGKQAPPEPSVVY